MRKIYIAYILVLVLFGCGAESDPKSLYKEYSLELEKTSKLSDFKFSTYLSSDAQKNVIDKLDKVGVVVNDFDFSISINGVEAEILSKEVTTASIKPEKAKKMMLSMLKNDTNFPSTYTEELIVNGDKAEWIIKAKNHPRDGDSFLKTIRFANDNGWKIDKIINKISNSNGSFKTTFY